MRIKQERGYKGDFQEEEESQIAEVWDIFPPEPEEARCPWPPPPPPAGCRWNISPPRARRSKMSSYWVQVEQMSVMMLKHVLVVHNACASFMWCTTGTVSNTGPLLISILNSLLGGWCWSRKQNARMQGWNASSILYLRMVRWGASSISISKW